uniref:Receptor ligand binding region domain-containing protein n=1 Tax=Callorhinchus milii TaxID=7868 RepID=A0A4W3GEJ8_CALMI
MLLHGILWFWLLIQTVSRVAGGDVTCKLQDNFNTRGLFKSGDVVLGGLFIVHFRTAQRNTSLHSKPEEKGLRWVQTMIFTIEEINRNPALLPNTTLGYRVMDSCDTSSEALKCTLQFLNQDEEKAPLGHQCDRSPSVPLIIGDAGSSHSAAVSRIVGLFGIPLVSYFATCACLSDKREFPTFLRTVPSDAVQVKALVSLVQRFQWTWVGVVAADSDYGQFGIQSFIEEVTNSNVCIAYIEFIPPVRTRDMIQQIVNTIGTSSARVMVLFCGEIGSLSQIRLPNYSQS